MRQNAGSCMVTEKRKRFIINFLYFAIILGIVIFICRYALGVLISFVVALLVALLLKPIIRFLREKCHIHKTVAGAVVVILFYALIVFLLTIGGIKLFSVVKNFVIGLPAYYSDHIEPFLMNLFDSLERFTERLDPSAAAAYDMVYDNVTQTLEAGIVTISKRLGSGLTNIAVGTPGFLLKVLIAIIATVFIAVDWNILKDFILRQCSEKTREMLGNIRKHLSLTLWRYIKSYALIMLITFTEICVGLLIIGIDRAVMVALLIAIFDVLPVVGSGMVLLPWTIITILQGNYPQAIGLGILYVVVIVVRNIMEPKIIGNRVGLHPVVTLLAMVVGTVVFGPIGLLGLPIALALTQSLNESGIIHLYKRKPKPAEEPPADPPPDADAPPPAEGAPPADGEVESTAPPSDPAEAPVKTPWTKKLARARDKRK